MSFNIQDLDKVNDNNQQNWPEGTQKVNEVNNAGRADEGMLARWYADTNGSKITTGTASAYVLSSDTVPTAYFDGFTMSAEIHADCAADATLNVDSLGAATIKKNDTDNLLAGDLRAGQVARFVYRGTTFRLISATNISDFVTLLSGKSRIINGAAPFINQRGNQTAMPNGQYFVDRWVWRQSGSGVVNGGVVTAGTEDYITIEVTTADASIGASDQYSVGHFIEANNCRDFNLGKTTAETVTLSFKHSHTKTGTYSVAFINDAFDRSYVAEYTQDVSNIEQTSTVTLTLDTTGAWGTGTDIGLRVFFALAAGSSVSTGTLETWQAAGNLASTNQVNAMDSTSNSFRVRDAQLEIGSIATATEYAEYGEKLRQCKRYYERITPPDVNNSLITGGRAADATTGYFDLHYQTKRTTAPSYNATGQDSFRIEYLLTGAAGSSGSVAFSQRGDGVVRLAVVIGTSSLTAGDAVDLTRNGLVTAFIEIIDELS